MLLTPVEIRDSVAMALASLRANKFRTFLTVLGVMIGVSSVVALASIIDGLDHAVEQEIENLGTNYIKITHLPDHVDYDELTEEERNRPYIEVGEAIAVRENCPSVSAVSPENHYWARGGNVVKYKNRKANQPAIVGTWPPFMSVHSIEIAEGRFISWSNVERRSQVCIIGKDIAEGLFKGASPIGKEIRVNGTRFEVIGVFARRESNLEDDPLENRKVVIPLSTFSKLYPWDEALTLTARAETPEKMDQALEEIINALRIHRKVPFNKPNNFAIATQETFREEYGEISHYIYLAMLTITSVGLMVGGIGVMNIMLVSVTERTREIGIRKAIGAKRSNIVLQFLMEAVTLSGSGGVVGIIFGILVGFALNAALPFPIGVSAFWISVGFIVAVSVGMVSGLYPAMKASRLDPIEALRYE